jgi:hypothetical protein
MDFGGRTGKTLAALLGGLFAALIMLGYAFNLVAIGVANKGDHTMLSVNQSIMGPIIGAIVGGSIGVAAAVIGAFVQKHLRERGSLYCALQWMWLTFDLTRGFVYARSGSNSPNPLGAVAWRRNSDSYNHWRSSSDILQEATRDHVQGLKFEIEVLIYNQKDVNTGLVNLGVMFHVKDGVNIPLGPRVPKEVVQQGRTPPLVGWPGEILVNGREEERWAPVTLPPKAWTYLTMKLEPFLEEVAELDRDTSVKLSDFRSVDIFGYLPTGGLFREEIAKLMPPTD